MKYFKEKLKQWINNTFNSQKKLFTYIYKSEYLTNSALNCIDSGISNEKYCDNEIIVSLTTFDRRIYEVYLAIESIMQQTMKPNRIVLWLSDELKKENIPLILRKQEKRGLEIRYCKDIRSYTKLIPSLKIFPTAVIITVDDDIFYQFDLIENLFNSYKINPKIIHSARIRKMKLLNNYTLEKYKMWPRNCDYFDISPLNFPTGVGGVLYPPHCFNNEIFNEKVFLDICMYADDVWFKAMALLNGVMAQKVYTHDEGGVDYINNKNIKDSSLARMNIDKGMNDLQIKAVFDKYNLYDKLI